ncbi:hypothetical protein JCM33774_06190 [Actinophytocola sp. KF-1]
MPQGEQVSGPGTPVGRIKQARHVGHTAGPSRLWHAEREGNPGRANESGRPVIQALGRVGQSRTQPGKPATGRTGQASIRTDPARESGQSRQAVGWLTNPGTPEQGGWTSPIAPVSQDAGPARAVRGADQLLNWARSPVTQPGRAAR